MNNQSTASEWYRLRDDRTIRSAAVSSTFIEAFKAGIKVSPTVKNSYSIQIMTLLTLNMLSRWCRNIVVEIPPVKSIIKPSRDAQFSDWLIEIMYANDPYGNFKIGTISHYEVDVILHIGIPSDYEVGSHFWIDGFGWHAGIGKGINPDDTKNNETKNLIGPSFAACLGVSELLQYCLKIPTRNDFMKWYSLYDNQSIEGKPDALKNPEIPQTFNLGNIHLIGVGAVGSSLTYLLGLTGWSGNIILIDFDSVEIPNCASSLLFTAADAFNEDSKSSTGVKYLRDSDFMCIGVNDSYSHFLENNYSSKMDPDIILCLANEQNIWNTVQTKYPPLVLHGTTTSSWGINMGRHIPLKEWCIMCRFEHNVRVKFRPPCGTSEIPVHNLEESVLANLPFLSPASAIIILAELFKLGVKGLGMHNFVEFSFKPSSGGSFISRLSTPRLDCNGCMTQNSNVYKKLRGDSKYWFLSE